MPDDIRKDKSSANMMPYSPEQLSEARRQLSSVLHKTREVVKTLQGKEDPGRYKSQLTLAQRRIEAFELSIALIEEKLTQQEE